MSIQLHAQRGMLSVAFCVAADRSAYHELAQTQWPGAILPWHDSMNSINPKSILGGSCGS